MKDFKFTEEAKDDLRTDLHTWDKQGLGFDWLVKAIEDNINSRIEQIVNERDGWMLKKDAELIEGEAYLVSDGKMVFGTARIAIGGVLRTPVFVDSKGLQYILCECGDFCMPLPSPPKNESK